MKVLINNLEKSFNFVEVKASIDELCRQFTLIDVSTTLNHNIGDNVKVYDSYGVLFIDADIEYINTNKNDKQSNFIYAGRNKTKYLVDSTANRTIQFSQGQNITQVLSEIANEYQIKVTGNTTLPTQEIKTILAGNNLILEFIEIANMAGKIIVSDAVGNIDIQLQSKEKVDKTLTFGVNIEQSNFTHDITQIFDEYRIITQSNYLAKQEQFTNINGVYGSGKRKKTKVLSNCLTQSEADEIAKYEFLKDYRKTLEYTARINTQIELNKLYYIKDDSCNINESMNCKTITLLRESLNGNYENYTLCKFERSL
jgi:prophage tail gpP-like protein